MESIINRLRGYDGTLPKEALKEAIKRQDEITPIFLKALDEVLADPAMAAQDDESSLYFYGIFLLAQFREKRAFPKVIELISLPSDDVELIFGDIITEDLPAILYSTYDGDRSLLERVIENPNVYFYVRGSVLRVLGQLYVDGDITHEYLVAYLRRLIAERVDSKDTERMFNTFIQGVVCDCALLDMVEDIERLYEEQRVSPTIYGDFDEFMDWMQRDDDRLGVQYIDDVITELQGWSSFSSQSHAAVQCPDARQGKTGKKDPPTVKQPYVRQGEKVGRNDPCPCGSGRKYKQCCMD